MANFRHYGETPKNFPQLKELTEIFAQMTANEQGFTNQVRHLYGVLGYGAHKLSGGMQVGAPGYSKWSEKNHSELVVPPNAVQVWLEAVAQWFCSRGLPVANVRHPSRLWA